MTDSAGRPGETEAVEAAHRATCHVPNCVARFDAEVAVDAAYPIIAEAVRAETADEVRALRTEKERLHKACGEIATEATRQIRGMQDDMIALGKKHIGDAIDELTERLVKPLIVERDSALAELAAARDQIAAVATIARQLMHGLTPKAEAERLIAAALSQSGQPTKGEPA